MSTRPVSKAEITERTEFFWAVKEAFTERGLNCGRRCS